MAASKNWFSPYFSRKRLSQLVVSQAVFTLLVQSDWLSAVWSIHESHLVLNRIISVLNRTIVALYCIISVSGTKWDVLYWFSHDVTKIQTKKLSILPRFYFHDALEQLKTNFRTNFRFKKVLGFLIEYAWISKLLSDVAFTWRPRELSCSLKNDLFREILLSRQFMY